MSGFVSTVTTEAQLNTDIQIIDGTTAAGNYTITFGANITEGNISITQDGSTVLPDLSAIDLHSGVTLTINGNGDSLIGTNGANTFRGLFVYSGNVAINDLTIKNAVATGGAGGYAGNFAGGGGAGLGGGLFIGNTGTVTLNQVYFSVDKAVGGAGGASNGGGPGGLGTGFYAGGGGMGGAGGGYRTNSDAGGGGGIGRTARGGTADSLVGPVYDKGTLSVNPSGGGIVIGAASGGKGASTQVIGGSGTIAAGSGGANGGGGGYGYTYESGSGRSGNTGGAGGGGGIGGTAGQTGTYGGPHDGYGGNGGFGGGGGGGYTDGGNGGFGGGGGGGYKATGAGGWGGGGGGGGGLGGFGGGKGGGVTSNYVGGGGGGGLGAGGDIFVYKGGSLIIQSGTLSGGSVAGGAGGVAANGASAGTAGGSYGSGIFIYGSNKTVTFTPALGKSVTVGDVITDQKGAGNGTNSGNVLLDGAGMLILSATNKFTGGTTLEAGGTLDLNASGAGGTGAISFGSGFGRLEIQSAAFANGGTFSNTVSNFVGGDAVDLAGLTFHSGASATVSGSTLKVISNGVTDALTLGSSAAGFSVIQDAGTGTDVIANTFTVASTSNLASDLLAINVGGVDSFSGIAYTFDFTSSFALSSTQTIDLGTASSVTFNGGNATTAGGYEVEAGTLIAGAAGAIGSGAVTVDSAGTLSLGSFSQTIGTLSGTGSVNLGTATLTEGTSASTTFSGAISGSGTLVEQGSGTLTLSGSNSFSGGITISAGTLALGAAGAAGSGPVTVDSGATLSLGSISQTISALSGAGSVNLGSATLTEGNATSTSFSGAISGSGTLVEQGSGELTLSGSNSFSGGITISAGTLALGAAGAAGSGPVTVDSGATLSLGSVGQTIDVLSGAGSINLGSATLTEGSSASTILSGAISGSGTLVEQGSGELTLSDSNNFSGGITVGAGTLALGAAGAAGTGPVTVDSGGTLSLGSVSQTIDVLSGAGSINLGSATLTEGSSASTILSGAISGSGTLVEQGSGELTLSGSNSFSGGITIGAGTLALGAGGAAGTGRVAVDAGATLSLGSVSQTIDVLSGAGAINLGSATLTEGSAASTSLSGAISGSGTLVEQGSGELTLSDSDSFSGGITIGAGTLALGAAGAAGTGPVAVGSGGTLSLGSVSQTIGMLSGAGSINLGSATLTEGNATSTSLSGAISGSGTLVKQGSGELTLSDSNNFSGGITLDAGTLDLTAASAAGTGTITFGSGTGDILAFSSAAAPANIVSGMVTGQTLDLTGQTVTSTDVVNTNTLQISLATGGPLDLTLDPSQSYAGDYFHFANSGANSFITEDTTPCYLAGTLIRTKRGEVPVETLEIGDTVITLDGTSQPIKWIGRRAYASAFAAGNRDVVPILIKAGALSDGVPLRDLYVSPLHAMFVGDVLIPAEHLVNGVSIMRCPEIDPIRYFHIELEQHDVIFAEGAPAETFVDCDSRGMFHNASEFATLYPGCAAPQWAFCAPRVESGPVLERVRRSIEARAGLAAAPPDAAPRGTLRGHLDGIHGTTVTGWAFDPDRPAVPVTLDVLDGEGLIARVTANRYRADLEAAGIADGRHAFELRLARGLSPRSRHCIRVRRTEDQAELIGSPLVLEPRDSEASRADAKLAIEAAAWAAGDVQELDALLTTVLQGVDLVRRLHGDRHRAPARDSRLLAWANSSPSTTRCALVIDDAMPRPDRDAGSNAVLSHIAALQALGWTVEFVASRELAQTDDAASSLEALGVACHRAPYVASVEEVLRRHRNMFGLVYLHRLSNAEGYAALARAWQPKARLIYSLADLHHVRLARQAAVQSNAELMAESRVVRQREINAMRRCDAVITHSTAEAAYLAQLVPGAAVHVVPWAFQPSPSRGPVAARQGIAFIGGYRHAPNADAVRWLADEIMPMVWVKRPDITCTVVGSDWPARLSWLTDDRFKLVGKVDRLDGVFGTVRATVAPLRFGAGLKGKVMDSLAAGVPCAMTSIAAEGIPLAGRLRELVADDAAAIAGTICRLHRNTRLYRVYANAGMAMIAARSSADIVTQAMEDCVLGRAGGVDARRETNGSGHGRNAAFDSAAAAA